MRTQKAVVILEVMWNWEARTSGAGHTTHAPRWFDINPRNHTGRRLHAWLSNYSFKVTNACPDLVYSAKGRGTPDRQWLSENLISLQPFDLLLVCGKVAQATYSQGDAGGARIIEIPHPAARQWNAAGILAVKNAIPSAALVRIDQGGNITQLRTVDESKAGGNARSSSEPKGAQSPEVDQSTESA